MKKEEKEKKIFGFLVNVPITSTSIIQMAYVVPLPDSSALVYSLFEQRNEFCERECCREFGIIEIGRIALVRYLQYRDI